VLANKAQETHDNIKEEEEEEWISHIEFSNLKSRGFTGDEIEEKLNSISSDSIKNIYRKLYSKKPVEILYIPDNLLKIANGILAEADCNQPFTNLVSFKDPYHFLSEDTVGWTNPTQNASLSINDDKVTISNQGIESTIFDMNRVRVNLLNLHYKIINAQKVYRRIKLVYLILTSDYKSFARKIKHIIREAPTFHKVIKDKVTDTWRNCENEVEQLIVTKEFHSNWMSFSKAKETCFLQNLFIAEVVQG